MGVKVAGVPVTFPPDKKPFPQQLALMAKMVMALKKSENALLESPTGTGKSLALISAVLSWQAYEYKRELEAVEVLREEERKRQEKYMKANKSRPEDTPLEVFRYDPKHEDDMPSQKRAKDASGSSKYFTSSPMDISDDDVKTNEKQASSPFPIKVGTETDQAEVKAVIKNENKDTSGDTIGGHAVTGTVAGTHKGGLSSSTDENASQTNNNARQLNAQPNKRNGEGEGESEGQGTASNQEEEIDDEDKDEDGDEDFITQPNPETRNRKRGHPSLTHKPTPVTSKVEEPIEQPTKRKTIPNPTRTVVFIASRTHSQIAQLVSELKRCPAELKTNIRMSVLASRMQYCVNPGVTRSKKFQASGARNEECMRLIGKDGPGCSYQKHNAVSSLAGHHAGEVWDVEDFVNAGKDVGKCAYFGARDAATDHPTVIFCPYNYLVDPIVRVSMNLDTLIEGAVLVIDEAHNIEDVSREAASFDCTLQTFIDVEGQLSMVVDMCDDVRKSAFRFLHAKLERVLHWFGKLTTSGETKITEANPVIYSGVEALVLLENTCGLDTATILRLRQQLKVACSNPEDTAEVVPIPPLARTVLESFLTTLEFMLSDGQMFARDFKMVIQQIEVIAPTPKARGRGRLRPQVTKSYSLGIWCLNPEIAFRALADKCRSIVLTSGTLSPLSSFARELGVPFKHMLEASHVIDAKVQLLAGVLPEAMTPNQEYVPLVSTYGNKNKASYQDGLGQALAKSLDHVPHGALCFFPSYSFMKACVKRWKLSDIWTSLINAKPLILIEGSDAEREDSFEDKLQSFRKAVETEAGALYLCVFRGKLSEGIDFSDKSARAVFIAGIPYPSLYDAKVKLKREYQDQSNARERHSIGAPLTGREWYSQQAFRALNQALGRCIRHKNDYGAVIFLDQRFLQSTIKVNLSKWMRDYVTPWGWSEVTFRTINKFFAHHKAREEVEKAESEAKAIENKLCATKEKRPGDDQADEKLKCCSAERQRTRGLEDEEDGERGNENVDESKMEDEYEDDNDDDALPTQDPHEPFNLPRANVDTAEPSAQSVVPSLPIQDAESALHQESSLKTGIDLERGEQCVKAPAFTALKYQEGTEKQPPFEAVLQRGTETEIESDRGKEGLGAAQIVRYPEAPKRVRTKRTETTAHVAHLVPPPFDLCSSPEASNENESDQDQRDFMTPPSSPISADLQRATDTAYLQLQQVASTLAASDRARFAVLLAARLATISHTDNGADASL